MRKSTHLHSNTTNVKVKRVNINPVEQTSSNSNTTNVKVKRILGNYQNIKAEKFKYNQC